MLLSQVFIYVKAPMHINSHTKFQLGIFKISIFQRSERNCITMPNFVEGSGYGHDRRVSSLGRYNWHDGRFHRVSSTRPLHSVKIRFFLSVMPPKNLAPFLYIPTKKPSFNDKVWTYYRILVCKRIKSRQTGKIGPLTNPATAPPQIFLSLLWYNLFMGVNEICVKI